MLLFDERIAKAERLGVDEIVVADFNENFKNTSCEDFIRELHRTLNISAVVCGFDYKFGKTPPATRKRLPAYAKNEYALFRRSENRGER